MSKEQLYNERLDIIKKCTMHEPVPYIPVISLAQTWAIAYAGETAATTFTSFEKECEVYAKNLIDLNFDATLLFGMNRPLALYESFGASPWFFSKDGITIQNMDNVLLQETEIDEFIENPLKFMRNKMLYRRYPALRKGFFARMKALANGANLMMEFGQKNARIEEFLKENVGAPLLAGDLLEPALDRYIGYRSFAEGMKDLRKRPEKVLAACDAMYPIVAPAPGPKAPFPYTFFPVVSATYLSRNNFEKFWWPTAKRAIGDVINAGGKVIIAMEGSWSHMYDFFKEFPKGSIVAFIEADDFIQAKKDIGDEICICGGMNTSLLRNGTAQENIDYIKNIIDSIGKEGWMVSQNQCLLSSGDVNPENVKAVIDFVHEYTA